MLKPVFTLSLGGYQATETNAVAGPARILIDRGMASAADALEVFLMERASIAPGDTATVELGHDDDRVKVFTGEVAEIRPTLEGVRVRALGKTNALLNLRVAAVYENQAVGSIVRDLVGQAGLDAGTIDNGPILPRYTVDRRLSAHRHVRELAERLGYELYTDRDGRLMFHALGDAASLDAGPLGAAAGAASALLGGGGEGYEFGKHLAAAAARQRSPGPTKVEIGGESPMSSQGDTTAHWLSADDDDSRGETGDGDAVVRLLDPAARTRDLADRFAAGQLASRSRRVRELHITVLGRPSLELGDSINVSGAADALVNRSGYVRALRHRLSAAVGFLTDVTVAVQGSA
jgi:phage protein D